MAAVLLYTYIAYLVENLLFPTTAVQQRQHVDAVGIRTVFSRLISVFVFNVLYIPTGCIKLVVGALRPFSLSFPGSGLVLVQYLPRIHFSRNVAVPDLPASPRLKLRINNLLLSSLLR